jgi:hypothetical protein
MKRNQWMFVIAALFIYGFTTLIYNLSCFKSFCYPTFDLGIYMEAVQKFSWHDLNPFLSSFGVSFLNDHWHPALALAKLPHLFSIPLSDSLFLTESCFVMLIAVLPIVLVRSQVLEGGAAALVGLFFILNQRTFEASMAFPVHPAVWANYFLLLATVWILSHHASAETTLKNDLSIFSAIFIAGFFGEQFSLSLLGLSLAYLFTSPRKRLGIAATLFSLAWVWFTLWGRSHWVGPILQQTERVSFSPQSVLSKYPWNLAQLKSFLKFVLESFPLWFVAIRFRKTVFLHLNEVLLISGIFLPLILGRVLSGSFGHQYDTLLVTAVAALALLLFVSSSSSSSSSRVHVPDRILGLSFVFFILLAYPKFEQAYGMIAQKKLPNCLREKGADAAAMNQERIQGLRQAEKIMQGESSSKILALGNLVPNLIQEFPRSQIIALGSPGLSPGLLPGLLDDVHWILVEHGKCGDPWPWDEQRVEAFVSATLRQPGVETIQNTPCLFFAHR